MKKTIIIFFYAFIVQFAVFGSIQEPNPKLLKEQVKKRDSTRKIRLSKSVLATGDWYRFYVEKTGVHKITPQFLSSLGMDISKINPNTIKIYGNGGHMLPLRNKENTEFDLRENAIRVIGVEDNAFSGDDHILFYGESTKQYNADSKTHINVYEDKSYYFITADGKKGIRVKNATPFNKIADTTITSFIDDQFYEVDQCNIGMMGRRWLENPMNANQEKQFSFDFPNRVKKTPIRCSILAVGKAHKPSELKVSLNKKSIGGIKFGPISDRLVAREGRLEKIILDDSDSIDIKMQYEAEKGISAKSYLDYIRISAERLLVASDKQMKFTVSALNTIKKTGEIELENTKKTKEIWDVTNPNSITAFRNTSLLNKITFNTDLSQTRKFIAIPKDDFYKPLKTAENKVKNQDLKGTVFLDKENEFRDIDYLIITQKDMLFAAERLADFHREYNKMNVQVVPVYKIYNEFSSGKQDIGAIRNFIRYVYENASVNSRKLSYVCFMGNATVDYKNKLMNPSLFKAYKKNEVPSFMSYESFSNTRSYVSDDFFVMMDPEEGHMQSKDDLDIVIGRILVDNTKTANEVVDKFLGYYQKKSFDDWRNNILLLSDDVDKQWEGRIQKNLNRLGDSLAKRYPFLNISKIYSDAYIQQSTSSGERYPGVTKELVKRIEKGVAVLDYFGHAEEDGFGIEFFFTKSDAIHLKNNNKLPLFITVTCLATRFDNPFDISVGEYIFKNPNGGAIAMIATTREIFMSAGVQINNKIIEYLFSENGPHLKPAKAVLKLKNELRYRDRRSVFFIGDPAMSLQMPRPGAQVTKINDTPILKFRDTLKALDKIKISGKIVNSSRNTHRNYDGEIKITVFDKKIERTTLANNNIKDAKGNLIKLDFKSQSTIIFRGNSSVKNGKFEVEFILPKDMDMSVGDRKISLYAIEDDSKEDLFGVEKNIVFGGITDAAIDDKIGPKINMLIEGEKAKADNIVGPDPILKIEFMDESGINLSNGIGHQIKMIVDENERSPIILNDFYINKPGLYKQGYITYKLEGLKTGYHSVKIKAWDTFNNSSVKKIRFLVLDSL